MKIDVKGIVAKVIGYISGGLESVIKPLVEVEVEKAINEKSDAYVDVVLESVKTFIPGPFDDGIINQYKDKIKADVKKLLLAEAEKISDKV